MIIHRFLIRFLLINIIFLYILNDNVFSQNDSIIVINDKVLVNKDYLITTHELHFEINDTIVETNICIRPNGLLDFIDSLENRLNWGFRKTIQKSDTLINLKEKYVNRNADTIFLKSYFPPLLTHDSSLLNYSEFSFDSSELFNYEMKYSTILSNFNEIKINEYEADTVIRIILPTALYDTCMLSYYPVPYSIMELTIKNGTGILCISKGHYDTSRKFIVTLNKSCETTNKELKKTIKRLQQVDFNKEYYTAVIGLLAFEECFIEIKLNDKYYAFERALYYGIKKGIKMRDYPKNKHISKLYMEIIDLKTEYLN